MGSLIRALVSLSLCPRTSLGNQPRAAWSLGHTVSIISSLIAILHSLLCHFYLTLLPMVENTALGIYSWCVVHFDASCYLTSMHHFIGTIPGLNGARLRLLPDTMDNFP